MKPNNTASLQELAREEWDIVVIGGGITGAAVLREASRSGLKCLLLEQRDFAWGASSRSGKWVHGGLRYIKEGQLKVTWHSVREREKLCAELPGLITLKPMLWPLFKGKLASGLSIRAGLFLYDLMAGKRRRHSVDIPTVEGTFPYLSAPNLTGAVCFYEGQTDDARLTMRVIQEARKSGAVALNYTEVTGLIRAGVVNGVTAREEGSELIHSIKAKQVIAATGAWSNRLRSQVHYNHAERLRPLRGSHLVFDQKRLPVQGTIVLEHPRDHRPGFITLFQGRVIVGNTDVDHKQDLQQDASITAKEVTYLLETVQHYFPDLNITHRDIISTFSGVRPVVDSGEADPSKESRDHVIWQEDELITIGGGKLTTFQHIAIDALSRAQHKFPHARFLKSQPVLTSQPETFSLPACFTKQQAENLFGRYGSELREMIASAAEPTMSLIPGTETFWFELPWCAAHEDVHHLDDLLLRRTRIGLLIEQGGSGLMERFKQLLQGPLNWSDAQWSAEAERYLALWAAHYRPPEGVDSRSNET